MDDSVGIIPRPLSIPGQGRKPKPAEIAHKTEQQGATVQEDPRLQEACMQMESLFLSYMLKEMRATVEKSGFISGGQAEEIFTSLLDVEISKKMAARGGVGLSALLMHQLGGHGLKSGGSDTR